MKRRIFLYSYSLTFLLILALAQVSLAQAADPVDLLVGAKWLYSIDEGKTFAPEPPEIKAGTVVHVMARTEFAPAETAALVVLELTHGLPTQSWRNLKFFLNDKRIRPPMEKMNYKTIPAIDAKMLKKGKNVLTARITLHNKRRKAKDYKLAICMRLAALKACHLKMQTGPVLGAFGEDHFTVTCRTNMPAKARLYKSDSLKYKILPPVSDKTGLIHRLKVVTVGGTATTRPAGKEDFLVIENAAGTGVMVNFIPVVYPSGGALRFVAMGDSRTYPKQWAKVAAAVVEAGPDLIVFSGDMVNRGRNDWEWDEQFIAPAKKLFASIPFYAVIGNHEQNAPVYNELFYTPGGDGRGRNWSQIINGVHLIGIDGREDFSPGGENAKWLEKTLADSKAMFIFFFTHYPAWTSSLHGRLDKKTGLPREKTTIQARDVLVPMLTKYKATAYICGHDHIYERSELPGGLTHIVSGGAGAPLRKKTKEARKQNPYSKVFVSSLHYCIIEADGNECTMKVVTPDGETIDTRTWAAREVKKTDDKK